MKKYFTLITSLVMGTLINHAQAPGLEGAGQSCGGPYARDLEVS